ncbi:hypothetical protein Afe04nite_72120 [Asanoa ferruginea]|nr:hypothetical protein [Asanoa ferruginea]GIF52673.1 hypothetical protein Afe04nite_72120 [Asanoa ferruginea]
MDSESTDARPTDLGVIIVSLAAPWTSFSDYHYLYLALAVVAVVVAVRAARRALAPIGPVVRAIAAVAGVAFAVGAAFVLVIAAVVSGS